MKPRGRGRTWKVVSCTTQETPHPQHHANPISASNISRGRLFVFSIRPSSPACSLRLDTTRSRSISSTFLISTLTSTTQQLVATATKHKAERIGPRRKRKKQRYHHSCSVFGQFLPSVRRLSD
ncbi:uncharacterized protein H6S33_000465 [Morchella sextelata]|uniref:uncharacterized protein n=1 Tax=Morchella sextelata TaxID=1174677 RepID=UPI001D053C93|nr:uncharacterized protein H6S33_000465 [Morchella sextelata]KAH0614829.1 hypothetical protein H6S33_000465 [Morchella sextelata]